VARIKYNEEIIKYISVFESLTASKVRDCVIGEKVWFIVEENEIGKAIGRKASNIRRLENMLKRPIRVVEYSPDIKTFIRNLIYPLRADAIEVDGDICTITGPDTKTKGLLIGRDRKNLNFVTGIVKRHFPIDSIKVV